MKARTALLELFKESSEWRAFFRSCCETSAFRLRSQAQQFRDELEERGHGFLTLSMRVAGSTPRHSPKTQRDRASKWASRACGRGSPFSGACWS